MPRILLLAACLLVLSVAATVPQAAPRAAAPQSAAVPPGATPEIRAALDRYCVTCHNARISSGGLALDALDPAAAAEAPDVWEKVLRRLQTQAMPPQGMPRPDAATYHTLVETLVSRLDAAAAARPAPGRPMLRRMNRAEYANAIRDLLALDVKAAALLPADDSAYGFDTIGDVLGVSPSLQERYLSAAAKISAMAVGDPERGPVEETYRVRQDLSQNQHIEGLPPGTIGGLAVQHYFPLDGEYEFHVTLQHTNFGNVRGLDYPHQVETTVDGARVHLATIGGDDDLQKMFEHPVNASEAIQARLTARVTVRAGSRPVGVAFIRNLGLADTRRLQPFLRSSANTLDWTGLPHIQSLTISGPFAATGPGETASRRRIFVCRPATAREELPCATRIIETLARRAYRQPVGEAELTPLLAFFRDGRRDGSFDAGIQRALHAILASPRFVFRLERDPDGVAAGSPYRLSGLELASRLSFFLWSSIPDDELLAAAGAGALHDPAGLERQVRRMLADPKSRALVENFAGQWLQLRNVGSVAPNSDEFPDFDDNLRQAFRRETELLFDSLIRDDRNVLDLLRADYTFLNERLARHYGVPGVYGSRFRRVAVTDVARKGLLGHGSVLALTSHAERTSPVLRGKWVLENILGTPPPPPPPNIPTLPGNAQGDAPKTMRELLTAHRASPTCAGCHKVMDPIGFALENFDAVGAWRTQDAGSAIDASGELADGTAVDGVVALRNALLRRPEVFVTTMSEKMLTYAVGRGLDARDMPAVRAIVRRAAAADNRFSSIVLGVVSSTPFQWRLKPIEESAASARASAGGSANAAN
jgi:hypothetical protein